MENICLHCRTIIPEGIMICPNCERDCVGNHYIIETTVLIDTVDKTKEFCSLCSKCQGDVLVYSGRYIVSGKSIMGLFSLDLTKSIKVEFYNDIPEEVKVKMKKFIVN